MSQPAENTPPAAEQTPPANQAPEQTKTAAGEQPVSPLEQAAGEKPAQKTEEPKGEPQEPVSPLAQAAGEKPKANDPKPEDVGAMTDEDYLKAVYPLAGKEGAPLTDDHAKALAAEFRKAGIGTKDAGAAMRTVAAYEATRAKADFDTRLRINRAMVKECRDALGADYDGTMAAAAKGGVALFGDDLARELFAIPEFGANLRIVEALARYGRANTDDPGIGAHSSAAEDSRTFAERWTGQPEA